MPKPILTVCLITYNHEKFIARALDSVLMQQLDYDWNIFIADDCSRDGTRAILSDYKRLYPDKIELLFQKENVGPARNWLDLLNKPESEYIAYLEGDDFWTSSKKLQIQLDFLQNNSNYSLCFHDVSIVDEQNMVIPDSGMKRKYSKTSYSQEDLLFGRLLAFSCTIMFRKRFHLNDWLLDIHTGDKAFQKILGVHGKGFFLDEEFASYRINHSSISRTSTYFLEKKVIHRLKNNLRIFLGVKDDGLLQSEHAMRVKANIDLINKRLELLSCKGFQRYFFIIRNIKEIFRLSGRSFQRDKLFTFLDSMRYLSPFITKVVNKIIYLRYTKV